jgi:hypothetical protein
MTKKPYKAGGKGQLQRQNDTPSWVDMPVLERDSDFVTFGTKTNWKMVPVNHVEKWEKIAGRKLL